MSLFVAFEGMEGSGKSTHVRLAADGLARAGHDPLATREPGGTRLGAELRRVLLDAAGAPPVPLAELLLYCADRAQHVREVIGPALAAGRPVLCDRFTDSTLAYQGYGRGLDLATIRRLDAAAREGVEPALTLLFDCPVDEGLARARRRAAADRMEAAPRDFHERVREGFRALARMAPERYRVLDATRPIDEVAAHVAEAIAARLGRP